MESNKKTAAILTLGCRVNQYESDCITEELQRRGFEIVPFGEAADISIINTCTVTAESDRKSRQMIRRQKNVSAGAPLIVTGCYAETGRKALIEDGTFYVKGNAKKSEIPDIAEKLINGEKLSPDSSDVQNCGFDTMTICTPHRTRSYIKIEDGCDKSCSYCIIPKARGNIRSKAPEVIAKEGRDLFDAGSLEVILTGIETAAYGRDFEKEPYYGYSLAGVIEDMDAAGYKRIGLGSLEPTVMNEAFVERISKISGLMPHFHLSVQSGSTGVLNRMRRRYNAKMLEEAIQRLKSAIPDATLSADIIVGFPGESEEEFYETVEFVRRIKFMHLHIFPYSKRAGTVAAEMKEQLPNEEKKRRLKILSDVQKEIKLSVCEKYVADHRENPAKVLVETVKNGIAFGHSEHFAEVEFEGDESMICKVCHIILESTDGEICRGKVVKVEM